ncbi:MAG: hypothetical protein HY314_07105 [Acidobacteria bacterium]|nr:hypothetical protein [Acidobacteriota bacterium]
MYIDYRFQLAVHCLHFTQCCYTLITELLQFLPFWQKLQKFSNNLRAAGINNASQLREELRRYGTSRIRGVGSKRGQEIRRVLSNWESYAKVQITLPFDVESRIKNKYAQQSQSIAGQLVVTKQKLSTLPAEISQAEWELRQLSVPSFGEFLKRNF